MAGSNRSPAQRGGQTPQQWAQESDEQARALEYERWQLQQRLAQQRGYQQPHQGYAAPPAQAPAPAGYDQGQFHGYAQPAHAPVDLDQFNPAGHAPAYPEPAPRTQQPFAPQFERFSPQQPQGQQHGYAEPQSFGTAPDPHGGFDARQGHGYEPPFGEQPAGFQGHPGYAGQHGADPRLAEPRAEMQSWDLSNYQPGQMPPGYPQGQAGHGDPRVAQGWPPQQQAAHDPHWQQAQAAHAQWQQGGQPAPQGYDGYDHAGQQHYGQQQFEPGFESRPGEEHAYDEDLGAAEAPRRGPSTVMIVGALIGAIVAGGGMAFAYKQFSGGPAKARLAELKRPTTPEKVRPADPGGRAIENTDKKFLNRLAGDTPPENQQGSDIDGPAKKVSTIPITINRDGGPAAPVAAPSSGVPGLLVDGFGPPPGGPPASLRPSQPSPGQEAQQVSRLPPPPTAPVAPRAVTPKVADLPLPKVISSPPASAEPQHVAVAKAPVPKKRAAAARDDFVAPGGAAEATPSGLGSAAAAKSTHKTTSATGFVAVLASKKSRQDALNSFADMHAQYPEILGGMTPDVREANLGDKGLWYRLIVGPPGSREAAQSVCTKLKERGMKDCWPVSY